MYRHASEGEPLGAAGAESAFEPRPFEADRSASIIETYQQAIWWLVGASFIITLSFALALGVPVDPQGAELVLALLAAGLIGANVVRRRPERTRIADTLGTLGLVWLAGLTCGVLSLSGLQLRFPVADGWLLALDRAAGVNGVAIIAWFAGQPKWLLSIMGLAYAFTIPVLFVGMGGLAMIGDRVEAWRAAFCFAGTLLTICLISIMTPAKGLCAWVSPEVMRTLPEGWACYATSTFDAFRGGDPVIRLESITGVVCFPSFHTVMGLITVAMWRKRPLMLALATAWFLPMLASTVPTGGHYVIDLLAGAMVWAVWFALSRAVEAARVAKPRPALLLQARVELS